MKIFFSLLIMFFFLSSSAEDVTSRMDIGELHNFKIEVKMHPTIEKRNISFEITNLTVDGSVVDIRAKDSDKATVKQISAKHVGQERMSTRRKSRKIGKIRKRYDVVKEAMEKDFPRYQEGHDLFRKTLALMEKESPGGGKQLKTFYYSYSDIKCYLENMKKAADMGSFRAVISLINYYDGYYQYPHTEIHNPYMIERLWLRDYKKLIVKYHRISIRIHRNLPKETKRFLKFLIDTDRETEAAQYVKEMGFRLFRYQKMENDQSAEQAYIWENADDMRKTYSGPLIYCWFVRNTF